MSENKTDHFGLQLGIVLLGGLASGFIAGLIGLIIGAIGSRVLLSEFNVYFDMSILLSIAFSTGGAILTATCLSDYLMKTTRKRFIQHSIIATLPWLAIWMLLLGTFSHTGRSLDVLIMILVGYFAGSICLLCPAVIPVKHL